MLIISHRINSSNEIRAVPERLGVEIDVRSDNGRLILAHDPFCPGECFEEWLKVFRHQTLLINVKEDGLEKRILKTLRARAISSFFFLDQPIPSLVHWANQGLRNIAVRSSHYEPIEMAKKFAGLVDWVWFDNLNNEDFDPSAVSSLKQMGFKVCFVSPELQGREFNDVFPDLQSRLLSSNLKFDAVCTKHYGRWEAFFPGLS